MPGCPAGVDGAPGPICQSQPAAALALDPQAMRLRLGREIRAWRESQGLKLESVAASVGVSISTISLWERGHRYPNIENLVALASVLRIPPCRFLCTLVAPPGWPPGAAGAGTIPV